MSARSFLQFGVRLLTSVISAGVFYTAWLAVFILLSDRNHRVLQAGLWLAAPLVTAAGFALGSMVVPHGEGARPQRFLRAFVWPLAGCAVGTAVVFPLGPMVIVFGIFSAGTVAVAVRELFLAGRSGNHVGDVRRHRP